jgi:hypothetical protein
VSECNRKYFVLFLAILDRLDNLASKVTIDMQRGLIPGMSVSITPDNTYRDNPTISTLVTIGIEEVVNTPNKKPELDIIMNPNIGKCILKVVRKSRL